MKTKLLIPENILFPIALFGVIFTVFTVSFDLTTFGIPLAAGKVLTLIAVLCSFITAVVLIIDVFKNNVSAKYFWTLGLLFTGGIAGLIYLMKRNKVVIES